MATPAPVKLRYDCALERLPERLAERFLRLQPDASVAEYLALAERRRLSSFGTFVARFTALYLSAYAVNGLLGAYPMHLLSEAQWRTLLGTHAGGRLLDVGAGSGDVTATLAPCFTRVDCTETAKPLVWRLRRRGFVVHAHDLAAAEVPDAPYDAVSLLNVVDRCHRPTALLAAALRALRQGGLFILAVPLPYRPVAYDGPYLIEPSAPLACRGERWEDAAASLIEHVLEPAGLTTLALSRVPYLAGGDAGQALAVHDDVVVVSRLEGLR